MIIRNMWLFPVKLGVIVVGVIDRRALLFGVHMRARFPGSYMVFDGYMRIPIRGPC